MDSPESAAELAAIHETLRGIRFFLGMILFAIGWVALGDNPPVAKLFIMAVLYVLAYLLWSFSEGVRSGFGRLTKRL